MTSMKSSEWNDDDIFMLGVTESHHIKSKMAKVLGFRWGRLHGDKTCARSVAGVEPISDHLLEKHVRVYAKTRGTKPSQKTLMG